MYVARGEVPLGIVYSTDAALEQKVRVVDTFPADTHEPITYPAAATSNAQPVARAYLEYLGSEDAAAIWGKFGFAKPPN